MMTPQLLNAARLTDILMFTGAVLFGYLFDGAKEYRYFDVSKLHLRIFQIMLFFAWLFYCAIAMVGSSNNIGLVIYIFYIGHLMYMENLKYKNKIETQVSFWKIFLIEIVREVILVISGFWRFS